MIVLTSFREARHVPATRFSAARWAPSFALDWPTVESLVPRYPSRKSILLRYFKEPLTGFRDAYFEALADRYMEVRKDLATLVAAVREHGDVYVCCWCPHSRPAQRALKEHGTFACHLLLLGHLFADAEIPWRYGEGHARWGVPEWRRE